MKALHDKYIELLHSTRTYLLQEYKLNQRILADGETYTYFRNIAIQKNGSKADPQGKLPSSNPVAASLEKSQAIRTHDLKPPSITKPPPSQPVQDVIPKLKDKEVLSPKLPHSQDAVVPVPNPTGKEKVLKTEPSEMKKGLLFVPESPLPFNETDLGEIRKIVLERHPTVNFLNTIPSDAEAKKKARHWEQQQLTHVLILLGNSGLKYDRFFENLRFAINIHGWQAILTREVEIEKKKGWDELLLSKHLRLIIAIESDIISSPELNKLCRKSDNHINHSLREIPLLLLGHPETYLKEPQNKAALWKTLQEFFANVFC